MVLASAATRMRARRRRSSRSALATYVLVPDRAGALFAERGDTRHFRMGPHGTAPLPDGQALRAATYDVGDDRTRDRRGIPARTTMLDGAPNSALDGWCASMVAGQSGLRCPLQDGVYEPPDGQPPVSEAARVRARAAIWTARSLTRGERRGLGGPRQSQCSPAARSPPDSKASSAATSRPAVRRSRRGYARSLVKISAG